MAIYTFTEALFAASSVEFTLSSLTAQSPRSAFNSMSFTSGPITEYWQAKVTIAPQAAADWRALRALMFQLRGGTNLLRMYDPSAIALRGAGGASPTININADAAAGAESIELKNLTPDQAVALAAGDYLGLGENLHMVMADAPSDSDGVATVSLLPAARQGVAEDDPVNTARVTGLFRLMQIPSVVIVPGSISQPVSIDLMEDPDVG